MMEKKGKYYAALAIFFAMGVAIALSTIYFDALFLSTYTLALLSYLFLTKALVNTTLMQLVLSPFKKRSREANILIVASLLLVGTTVAFLLPLKLYWIPFIGALYTTIVVFALEVVSTSFLRDYFSSKIRSDAAIHFMLVKNCGLIVSSFLVLALQNYFPLEILLYLALIALLSILIILFVLPAGAYYHFRQVESMTVQYRSENVSQESILRDPLIKTLLPMIGFMSIGYYSADYLFKAQLIETMNREAIVHFLAIFIATVTLAASFFELYLPRYIMYFGAVPMFYLMPFLLVSGLLIVTYQYNMMTIALFAFTVFVAYSIFYRIFFEMALSPIAAGVKLSLKKIRDGMFGTVGLGIVGLFFLILAALQVSRREELVYLLLFTMAYCTIWLLLISRARKEYYLALKNVASLRGFALEAGKLFHINRKEQENVAQEILSSPSNRLYTLGFSLISKMSTISPSSKSLVFKKMDDEDEYIRMQAICSLESQNQSDYIAPLLAHLKTEKSDLVVWKMAGLIVKGWDDELLNFLDTAFAEKLSSKQVYLAPLAFTSGDQDLIDIAVEIVQEASESKDKSILIALARAIGLIPNLSLDTYFEDYSSLLSRLIDNDDAEIASEAIKTTAMKSVEILIPKVASHLEKKKTSHIASKALQAFGARALEAVIPYTEVPRRFSTINLAIKTLTSFEGGDVEKYIVTLGNSKSDLIKTSVARHALAHAVFIQRSSEYREMVYVLILEEAKRRMMLKSALKLPLPIYIRNEIKELLHKASLRLIYWFGSYEEPETIFKLSSTIKGLNFEGKGNKRFDEILELMTALASRKEIKNIFKNWHAEPAKRHYSDRLYFYKGMTPYLDDFISYHYQPKKDEADVDTLVQRLITMRQVKLFEYLDAEILYSIAEKATLCHYKCGQMIFTEGDMPTGVYIIVEGSVVITSEGEFLTSLTMFDFFGENGVIEKTPRLGAALAATDVTLLHIDQDSFDALVLEYPEILKTIIKMIASYLVLKSKNHST